MKARLMSTEARTLAQGAVLTYDNGRLSAGLSQNSGVVSFTAPATFLVTALVNCTAQSTSDISFALTTDSVDYVTATFTPAAESAEIPISLSALVTVTPALNGVATLSIKNIGAEVSVTSASISIVEV